jgi:hypothetical protein
VPLSGIKPGHPAHIPLTVLYVLPRYPEFRPQTPYRCNLRYKRDGRVASGKATTHGPMCPDGIAYRPTQCVATQRDWSGLYERVTGAKDEPDSLQAGRSRVRVPMRSLKFVLIYPILATALGPGVDSASNRNAF